MTVKEWAHELPRRIMNMLVAVILIVIFVIPMGIIATIIFLSDPRSPVVFTQRRVGMDRRRFQRSSKDRVGRRKVNLGGKPFTIYKFRTMSYDPHRSAAWAGLHDSYITWFGTFLRKYRLDELPQLFNVMKGDMNIVGPRPEQPEIALEIQKELRPYNIRHFVLPGITGLAQINLGYDTSLDDVNLKLDLDLKYVEQRSVWLDVKILLATPFVMLFGGGSK